ncbi:MAG: SpoIID/LytB domain-containing protein, partial [Bryobacteraceae bacterium]
MRCPRQLWYASALLLFTTQLQAAFSSQRILNRVMRDLPAAAAVLDLRTGRIVAIQRPAIVEHEAAFPGSTLKPLALLALLQAGKLSPKESFVGPHILHINSHNLTCSHARLNQPVSISMALAYSCNAFVAHFAPRFSDGEFAEFLRKYGFGSQGTVVNAAGPSRRILQALGEGDVTVTPMELLRAYARLAREAPEPIRQGLEYSVGVGTGQLARVGGLDICGKTGTAGGHAWFAGFSKDYAVVVLTTGHSGGADAAPIAGKIFRAFAGNDPRIVTVKEKTEIDFVPLEDYVAGVLAGEAQTMRSDEARKAMAVAARTFAVRFRGRHKAEGFDLCPSTHCQVFHPKAVTARDRAAARATAGELLWYQGTSAVTYYSQDCGGTTEDARAVWPDLNAPYLDAHHDDYCTRTGRLEWRAALAPNNIAQALSASGLRAPVQLHDIAISQHTSSGRVATLRLIGDGPMIPIAAGSLRLAIDHVLGWNTLRSNFFEIHSLNGRIVFHGYGSGHGVGLCQRGADMMGAAGKTYRQILDYYYPGTSIGITARCLDWRRLNGERVDLLSTDPPRDQRLLPRAEAALRRAESRTGMHLDLRPLAKVYPSVATFRDSTGEPGDVAGDARGRLIRLQPNPSEQTLLHEMLHLVVENHAR